MESICLQVRDALIGGAPYAALVTALTIPEICGRAEQRVPTSGRSVDIYSKWYDSYVGDSNKLTGSECYYLRCGFLHHGESKKDKKMRYDRVAFILPNQTNSTVHGNVMGGIVSPGPRFLTLDLSEFCRSICSGAETWKRKIDPESFIMKNMEDLVQLRPYGYGRLGNLPVIV